MSLIFADSFDHYGLSSGNHVLNGKWSSASIPRGNGRRGTWGADIGVSSLSLNLPSSQTDIVLGMAIFLDGGAPIPRIYDRGSSLITFMNDGTIYLSIGFSSDGRVRITRGAYPQVSNTDGPPNATGYADATELYTSPSSTIVFGQWNYIEFKAHFSYSASLIHLKWNGETLHNSSADRTIPYGYVNGSGEVGSLNNPTYITQMSIGGTTRIDDLYLLNTEGATNNDFLGDVQVDCLLPNGAGLRSDSTIIGTAPAGTRWASNVDADNGITGVQLDATGDSDSYTFTDLAYDNATIHGVQVVAQARKSDGGPARIALTNDVSGSTLDATPGLLAPSSGEVYGYRAATLDASAAGAWTYARVQASQFGVRREVLP